MNVLWTEEEKEFIRRNAATIPDKIMATQLSKLTGRKITLYSLRKQRQKLNITKARGRGMCKIVEPNGVTPKPQGMAFHIKGK